MKLKYCLWRPGKAFVSIENAPCEAPKSSSDSHSPSHNRNPLQTPLEQDDQTLSAVMFSSRLLRVSAAIHQRRRRLQRTIPLLPFRSSLLCEPSTIMCRRRLDAEHPHIHPIEVRLMVRHDHQVFGQVDAVDDRSGGGASITVGRRRRRRRCGSLFGRSVTRESRVYDRL